MDSQRSVSTIKSDHMKNLSNEVFGLYHTKTARDHDPELEDYLRQGSDRDIKKESITPIATAENENSRGFPDVPNEDKLVITSQYE